VTANPKLVVERAIARTKRNAWQQLAMGSFWLPFLIVMWGFTTLVIVMIAINVLVGFFLVRRLVRLRRGGAARVLLDEPTQVKEIASWPRKLPPNQLPVFIDIFTINGATCTLMLDRKNPQDVADLLGALHSRSPEALLLIPKLPVTVA
jgi:hypothetical protein